MAQLPARYKVKGKLFDCSKFAFPHLQDGDGFGICILTVVRINEIINYNAKNTIGSP